MALDIDVENVLAEILQFVTTNEEDRSVIHTEIILSNCNTCGLNEIKSVCRPKLCHQLVGKSYSNQNGNFMKGSKWSPDGLCFLSNNNHNILQLWNTPHELLSQHLDFEMPICLKDCISVKEPEIVYDFCWWPLMNSQDPDTCCFASSSKDQPVHLWDAFDGSLRASYIALDNVQEIQSAQSLCFSPDGLQLLCGFKKEIFQFYVDRPGSTYEKWSTFKRKPYKSGQTSIISCMEFGPDGTLFACGCYDKTVGIYSPKNGDRLELITAHDAGVTCIKFSSDGNRLYTGARKEGSIKCWDIRWFSKPVFHMKRQVNTNQRIFFDLVASTAAGHETNLISGSTDGKIIIWDLNSSINEAENHVGFPETPAVLEPCFEFQAHNDCANGCSWHPYLPVLLTSSGQRHFPQPTNSDGENEDSSLLSYKFSHEENTVKLWNLSTK